MREGGWKASEVTDKKVKHTGTSYCTYKKDFHRHFQVDFYRTHEKIHFELLINLRKYYVIYKD